MCGLWHASDEHGSGSACRARVVPCDTIQVTLKKAKLLQHSHSTCLTPNYLLAHIDHFAPRYQSAYQSYQFFCKGGEGGGH